MIFFRNKHNNEIFIEMTDNQTPQQTVFYELQKPNNKFCADCKEPNPRWVSTKYGIFICKKCANIHKTLFQKEEEIKSVDESQFTSADVSILRKHGNKKINDYYECNLIANDRPTENKTSEMSKFIENKYVKKQWANSNKRRKNIIKKLNRYLNEPGAIVTSIFVSLIILFILRLTIERSNKIVKTISLEAIILFEVSSIKENIYSINPFLLYQVLYGLAGFGFIDGFLVVILTRLIRIGLSFEQKGIFVLLFAAILILIRFGIEIAIVTVISVVMIFFTLRSFISELPKGDLIFSQKFLE